jgi:hypothetical protein
MHVCMYVFMYVCMYVCMYECLHKCMHISNFDNVEVKPRTLAQLCILKNIENSLFCIGL